MASESGRSKRRSPSLSDDASLSPSEEEQRPQNMFKNDGSFLEMFKRMQEQQEESAGGSHAAAAAAASAGTQEDLPPAAAFSSPSSSSEGGPPSARRPAVGFVGKRRGGKILPTGIVKKPKKDQVDGEESSPKDAWAQYMAEVRKYRERSCEEEGKTRPLVK